MRVSLTGWHNDKNSLIIWLLTSDILVKHRKHLQETKNVTGVLKFENDSKGKSKETWKVS